MTFIDIIYGLINFWYTVQNESLQTDFSWYVFFPRINFASRIFLQLTYAELQSYEPHATNHLTTATSYLWNLSHTKNLHTVKNTYDWHFFVTYCIQSRAAKFIIFHFASNAMQPHVQLQMNNQTIVDPSTQR